jgi:hypothetical protein
MAPEPLLIGLTDGDRAIRPWHCQIAKCSNCNPDHSIFHPTIAYHRRQPDYELGPVPRHIRLPVQLTNSQLQARS